MKLNNLSRLTALLLAVVLFLSSIVYAETVEDYEALTDEYYADCTAEQNVELCAFLAELAKMKPSERYGCMLEAFLASNDGATWATAIQLHHYFGHYVNNDEYKDLLCTCTRSEDASFEGYWLDMYPYGDDNHLECCPWYQSGTSEYNEAVIHAQEFLLLETDQEKTDFVADDKLTDTQLYDMLDVLGWRADSERTSGDVTVKGALPKYTSLTATALTGNKVSDDVRDFIMEQGGVDDSIWYDCQNYVTIAGYNVELNFYGRKIEPKNQLAVTIANAHSNSRGAEYVDAYIIHVLEDEESIAKETAAENTVYYSTDSILVDNYTNYTEGTVAYTLVSDTNETDGVLVTDEGSMTFTVDSLSDIIYDVTGSDGASTSNFKNYGYFYWRYVNETSDSHTYGDGTDSDSDGDVDCIDDVVASVTYVSEATNSAGEANSGTVPHFTYTGHVSGATGNLDIDTVLNTDNNSDLSGGCTINITTKPGYVVTSFVIACENWATSSGNGAHNGEGCTTVSGNNLTVGVTDDGYYSNLNIIIPDVLAFSHGSNSNASKDPMNYVLLIEVKEVNASIGVDKEAEPSIVTAGDSIEYEITATNNSTTEYDGGRSYTSAEVQDGFLSNAVTIKSITLKDADANGKITEQKVTAKYTTTTSSGGKTNETTTTVSSYPKTVSAGAIDNATLELTFPSGVTWDPGEQLVITYTYTATTTDATAGSLTNVALVTGILTDGTEVSDTGVASVKVIVNQATKGNLRVVKTFKGLTEAQVSALVTASDTNTTPFYFTAKSTSTDLNYSSLTGGEIHIATSGDDVVLYWDIIGAIESTTTTYTETFTVTEHNYEVEGYAWSSTDTSQSKDVTVAIAATAQVAFVNSYSEQPQTGSLTITKSGLKTGESAIFNVYEITTDTAGAEVKTLYTKVVLTGGYVTSVTLTGLMAETVYLVEEDTAWAWSYTPTLVSASNKATIVAAGNVTVEYSNAKDDQWLHDENGVINDFSKTAGTDMDN